MRKLTLLIVGFLVAVGVASAQTLSPQVRGFVKVDAPVVALTHVRVIDGTGAAERDDQTVIISNGKIESVSDAASANVPKNAQVLDLHGYTIIPGLVGMHDHMFYPMGNGIFGEMGFSFPRLYVAAGVTTIRTAGGLEAYTDLELKKQIDRGATPGPKIHVTGPYLEGPGSFAVQMHALTGPDDATKTVNYWLDEGVDNFKAYMFITPAELSAAVAAAHKRGAKVTGHLCSIGFREAAAIGIDDLEHGLLVDTEFFPWKKPGECPENLDYELLSKLDVQSGPLHDTILDLVQHHVAVTSTLPVFEMFVPGRPTIEQRVLDALSPDARSALLNNKVRASDANLIRKRYHGDASPWPAAFKKEMGDADAAAREVLERAGLGERFGHGLGHGVGLEVHEAPRLARKEGDEMLQAGNVVTIEPGVYIPGAFGVRIEDLVALGVGASRIFTSIPKELTVLE